jgi:hypothetical protein
LFTNRFQPNLMRKQSLECPTLGKSKYPEKGSNKGALGKKVRKITFFDIPELSNFCLPTDFDQILYEDSGWDGPPHDSQYTRKGVERRSNQGKSGKMTLAYTPEL